MHVTIRFNLQNSRAASKKATHLTAGVAPLSSPVPAPPIRLPKEAYDTLKDKQLRERLQRHELSTHGSRAKMQARHEKWVVIFNANLDQAPEQQKSVGALRAQLTDWENGRERDERERTKANGIAIDADYEVCSFAA